MNRSVKRTIYLTVIALISIGCVIAGVIINTDGFSFLGLGKINIVSNEVSIEAFDSIKIDADVMGITLKRGADYSFSYEASKKIEPVCEVKNGQLVITQSNGKKINGTSKCDAVITIPDNVKLESFDANIDVGNVTIEDYTIEDMTVACDVGNINIDNVSFEKLDIDVNIGDAEISSSQMLDDYSIEAKTDVGEVCIDGKNEERSYNVTGGAGSIKVKLDIGDIDIRY